MGILSRKAHEHRPGQDQPPFPYGPKGFSPQVWPTPVGNGRWSRGDLANGFEGTKAAELFTSDPATEQLAIDALTERIEANKRLFAQAEQTFDEASSDRAEQIAQDASTFLRDQDKHN